MADFTYDLAQLQNAKKAIDALVDALNTSNSELTIKLSTLQTQWNTDAGRKFFEEHKDTWTKYVNKYSKKLNGVSEMLNAAITEYEAIDNDVSGLST